MQVAVRRHPGCTNFGCTSVSQRTRYSPCSGQSSPRSVRAFSEVTELLTPAEQALHADTLTAVQASTVLVSAPSATIDVKNAKSTGVSVFETLL